MKTRCPSCGALCSLDALVANDGASEALAAALRLSGELGRTWIQYLGLFRPANSQLSFDRVAKITNEAIPDIEAGRIVRNQCVYDAPAEAWIYAIKQVLKARDEKRLKTPLKSHGYLYEILTSYKPEPKPVTQSASIKGTSNSFSLYEPKKEEKLTEAQQETKSALLKDAMKSIYQPMNAPKPKTEKELENERRRLEKLR